MISEESFAGVSHCYLFLQFRYKIYNKQNTQQSDIFFQNDIQIKILLYTSASNAFPFLKKKLCIYWHITISHSLHKIHCKQYTNLDTAMFQNAKENQAAGTRKRAAGYLISQITTEKSSLANEKNPKPERLFLLFQRGKKGKVIPIEFDRCQNYFCDPLISYPAYGPFNGREDFIPRLKP